MLVAAGLRPALAWDGQRPICCALLYAPGAGVAWVDSGTPALCLARQEKRLLPLPQGVVSLDSTSLSGAGAPAHIAGVLLSACRQCAALADAVP